MSVFRLAVFIGIAADRGNYDLRVVLLQQRKGVIVVIVIAVVKSKHHWLLRQRNTFLHIIDQVLHYHGMVSVFFQVL